MAKVNEADLGRIIQERRRQLGLTQEEVALRAGVSPSLITKLEQGRQDILKMKTINLMRLLDVLGLTPEDLGLEHVPRPHPHSDLVLANARMVPVLGSTAAGQPYGYPVPVDLYRPSSAVFFVEGDSMDDGSEDAIRDGDMVLVDLSLTELRPGKLYVVELIGDGYTLKEARKLNGEWVLIPWNPAYPITRPDEARVVGEVYAVSRFRRVRR